MLRSPSNCFKSKILITNVNRYTAILIENRYGNVTKNTQKKEMVAFCEEFDNNYALPILQSHLNIVLAKKTNFVGTKTLSSALKLVTISLKTQRTRLMIQDKIGTLLYDVCLPLMLITQHEYMLWQENPIEYVRYQVDQSNTFNPKKQAKNLIKVICSIKQNKREKIS